LVLGCGTRCRLSAAISCPYTGLSSNACLAVDLGGGPNTAGTPAEGSEPWVCMASDAEIGFVVPVYRSRSGSLGGSGLSTSAAPSNGSVNCSDR